MPLRQIAVRNIGHEHPTLLITNDLTSPAKDLFARCAERIVIENQLDADISGFHLNALSSGLPLNVDLSTTLTVLAGNCYACSRASSRATRWPPRQALAPLRRLRRQGPRQGGPGRTTSGRTGEDHVRVDLALRTYTPVLIDAGFPEMEVTVPWWGGRKLRFGFPPR